MSAKVAAWLDDLGLGQYASAFAENAIDWDLLPELDQQTLKDIGVEIAGHRLRLLKAATGTTTVKPPGARNRPEAEIETPRLPENDTAAWSRTPGERKPVTMLFADIVDSTGLTEKLDAEEAHELLYRAIQHMCRAVEDNRGTVCRFMGDGLMAMFGAPRASERHALEACRAALDMQQAVKSYSKELLTGYEVELQIRVGLHSGEVVVLEVGDDPAKPEYDASGPTVPLAARMEQSARPGEILMTEQTRKLAGKLIRTRGEAEIFVKGINHPVRTHRLQRIVSAAINESISDRSPFVGRNIELTQFSSLLDACLASGRGQTVYLRGEAGIGKTRLLGELSAMAKQKGFVLHRALVLDFGTGKGQGAVSSLTRSFLDIGQGKGKQVRKAALDQAEKNGLVSPDDRIFMNDLLDLEQPLELRTLYDAMDALMRQEGKGNMLVSLVKKLSSETPIILSIEDLHWADSITLGYLSRLVTSVTECVALMIITSRADGDPIDSAWRASACEAPIITWDLSPLRPDESVELVSAFIDSGDEIAIRCIERAAGNPLFLNQLLLSIDREGTESVPDSIKSLILSRMDQLPKNDKRALQAAAVLGQRFDLDELRHLTESPGYDCNLLVEHHLIRPEAQLFLFAHALIQEGAYSSLIKSQRQKLHRRAAAWFRDRDRALYAEHLDNAGESTAPEAYLAAAREQLAAFRPELALQLVRKGLKAAPAQKQFDLLCLEGELLRFTGLPNDSIATYRSARAIAGEPSERCRALVGIAEGLSMTEDHESLLELLDEAEALAESHDLWIEQSTIGVLRSGVYFFKNDYKTCVNAGQKSLRCAKKTDSPEVLSRALSGLADAEYSSGHIASAHDYFDQCIELARRHGLGRIIAANLSMRGFMKVRLNDLEGARADFDEAMELAKRTRHLRAEMIASHWGKYLAEMGELDQSEKLMQRGLDISRQLGSRLLEAANLCGLARILCFRGKRKKARIIALQAIEILQNTHEGMVFRGATAYGILAMATNNGSERREALKLGEALLDAGCMGHNYYDFYEDAIEACIRGSEWDKVDDLAGKLEACNSRDFSPRSELYIEMGRLLSTIGRGDTNQSTYGQLLHLVERVRKSHLLYLLPTLEKAVSSAERALN